MLLQGRRSRQKGACLRDLPSTSEKVGNTPITWSTRTAVRNTSRPSSTWSIGRRSTSISRRHAA